MFSTHETPDRIGMLPAVVAEIEIVVNGDPKTIASGATVSDLIAQLGLSREHVAVECNRQIVPRDAHDRAVLSEGDTLEIVTFVGGG